MKASEYKRLKRLLESLTDGADTLRAVFAKAPIAILEPDTVPGRTGKPDHVVFGNRHIAAKEARQHPDFKQRYTLLDQAERMVDEAAAIMEECVDEFVSEDRGGNAVIAARERALYPVLIHFLDATATPIQGAAGLYEENKVRDITSCRPILRRGLRPQCREWADMLTTWFPNIGTTTGIDTKPAMTTATGNAFVDRLKSSDAYKKAIEDGTITAPFTWNGTIKDLAYWLLNNDLILDHSRGVSPTRKWCWADSIFKLPNGSVVTRGRLKNAFYH